MDGLRRLLFVCRRRLFTSSFGRQPELQFISNEETGLPSRLLPLATQMLIRTVEKEVESDFRLLSSPASSLETWFFFSFFSLSLDWNERMLLNGERMNSFGNERKCGNRKEDNRNRNSAIGWPGDLSRDYFDKSR